MENSTESTTSNRSPDRERRSAMVANALGSATLILEYAHRASGLDPPNLAKLAEDVRVRIRSTELGLGVVPESEHLT